MLTIWGRKTSSNGVTIDGSRPASRLRRSRGTRRRTATAITRVKRATGGTQQPWVSSSPIAGQFYFAGLPSGKETTPPVASSDAERTWAIIQNSTSLAVLDDFIRQFGSAPVYGSMARARQEELAKQQVKETATIMADDFDPDAYLASIDHGEPAKPATGQQTAAVTPLMKPALPASDPCSGPVIVSFPSRCAAPLTAAQERGLKPKDSFRECENCPEMVVVPAGAFTMGSPDREKDGAGDGREGPQHTVTIGKPFAVGKLHVTVIFRRSA